MRRSVLDTNVLLRFFIGDHAEHQEAARTLFAEAEKGKRECVVLPIVVAEAAFVLESVYKQSRTAIADTFEILLSQRWLDVLERDILLHAIGEYRTGEHFVDCYLAAWSELEHAELVTFDRKLKKRTRK
ncbi:PIN domain-containing protein [Candidatus Uhrbacteria bacterium]|nr:PIN domain-containing protein [Candidatus Uhrbacteria bacterium]